MTGKKFIGTGCANYAKSGRTYSDPRVGPKRGTRKYPKRSIKNDAR